MNPLKQSLITSGAYKGYLRVNVAFRWLITNKVYHASLLGRYQVTLTLIKFPEIIKSLYYYIFIGNLVTLKFIYLTYHNN